MTYIYDILVGLEILIALKCYKVKKKKTHHTMLTNKYTVIVILNYELLLNVSVCNEIV